MKTRAIVLASLFWAASAFGDERTDALEHFRIGLELVQRKQIDPALAEFLRSRELFPTKGALENAAVCLRDLGRFDEALDMYDELVARFGSSKPVEEDMARIAEHVGTLAVSSDVPSAVLVDGLRRARGRPIRLTAGAHAVRFVAEGRAPFETTVTVEPKKEASVHATLPPVARVGSVRVVEKNERVFEVLVDGGVVGRTPWEGSLPAGEHVFALRGENDVGAPPTKQSVEVDQRTAVTLSARKLPGAVRIEPTPDDAEVRIDGRFVARGTFAGSLPSGDHELALDAPWSEPLRTSFHVSSEKSVGLRPSLERIRRVYAEIVGGGVFGDMRVSGVSGCADLSCMGNIGGARLGYMFARHFGFDAFAYSFSLARRSDDGSIRQTATLTPNAIGGSLEMQLFDRTPLLLRFGAGAAYGTLDVGSTGLVQGIEQVRGNSRNFVTAVLVPEVRYGYRISRAFAVDAGVSLVMMVIPSLAGTSDDLVPLPIPTVTRGLAYFVPITLGLRLFL